MNTSNQMKLRKLEQTLQGAPTRSSRRRAVVITRQLKARGIMRLLATDELKLIYPLSTNLAKRIAANTHKPPERPVRPVIKVSTNPTRYVYAKGKGVEEGTARRLARMFGK